LIFTVAPPKASAFRQGDGGNSMAGEMMRFLAALLKWLLVIALVAVLGVAGWLYFAPPAMIRVATGYSAKIVCSNVFIAGRDADEVLAFDVQAPGHPILKLIDIDVDRDARTVRAGLLGLFGNSVAIARQGLGCASVPDGDVEAAAAVSLAPVTPILKPDALWPAGERVEPSQSPAIATILNDREMTGPGMRAVVVVHNGRIVGERYGPGFSAETPLLGWSMTKTVTSAIVGTLIREEQLALDQTSLFEEWSIDRRDEISLADLMSMSSGLEFNEDYGDVTDVTRMLYLEPDMAGFAASKPLADGIGEVFSYSSGTSVMIARIWQDLFDDEAAALAWPRKALFAPLGMDSAVMETDARGTFVGSSYVYATARDWARFGQFLLQEGVWNGRQILPEGYTAWMRDPAPTAPDDYGRGQVWLHGPTAGTPEGEDPDAGFDLPDDAFWMLGHDGQTVAIVPSKNLVVVRLGLTPSGMRYKPQAMVAALAAAVGEE
jgi:CubicO group peptidase (beta-lactamase class C family)